MLEKEKIGKIIAMYRKEHGMTQKELAELLNISYQAISKWEAGISIPTVEMLYELAELFHISVDEILHGGKWENRSITFMDVGLDTKRLYMLKENIVKLASDDEKLISANFADAALFKIDTKCMEHPVYAMLQSIPGSKEKLANRYGYDKEICIDVAASGINHMLQHGIKPVLLKAMLLCHGNKYEQMYGMAQTFEKVCKENGILFAGMEIAAQPMNYTPDEYHVSASLVGVEDEKNLITREKIQEGDVVIGLQTEGIDGTNYPVIKVMLDRNPELLYEKIDDTNLFLDEIMRGNIAFTKGIRLLQEEKVIHGVYKIKNHLLNSGTYDKLPQGLGLCIDLAAIPIKKLYRFLYEQDMIGVNSFPHHFHFGISMLVIVPEKEKDYAIEVLQKHYDCCIIGKIEKAQGKYKGQKVWTKGELRW